MHRKANLRDLWSNGGVNHHDYNSLLSSLNDAVAILARNRTPDPELIAAYDTLKLARAKIVRVVENARPAFDTANAELVAA